MSRVKRFAASMVSGYLSMGANVLYTLCSIPLALHYLGKEEFGLWVLTLQVCSYLTLVDFGMGTALARILGDYKDDRDGGAYGSVLKTAMVVSWIQAVVMAVLGIGLAQVMAGAMDVPDSLKSEFRFLMLGQSLILAVSLGLRSFSSPLWCHHRLDVVNFASMGNLLLMLAVLWLGLRGGMGLVTMLWASAAGMLLNTLICMGVTWRLGLLPSRGHWGRFDMVRLRELLEFSRDLFLMVVGSQLINASQIIIVTRVLGLDMAAVWAVGTKMFTLAQQMVGKILEASAPTLTEMVVRGEEVKLRRRFMDVLMTSGSMAVLAGGFLAALNSDFVTLWTHGKIQWPKDCDILLFVLLAATTITRCHTGLAGITKEIKSMRYVYLVEGVLFVALALVWGKNHSFEGIIFASLVANLSCSGAFGCWRSARRFGVGNMEVWLGWNKNAGLYGILLVMFLLAVVPLANHVLGTPFLRMAVLLPVTAVVSALLLWFFGLSPGLRKELQGRMARYTGRR